MIRRALFALGAALVLLTGPGRLLWQLARERDRETERRRARYVSDGAGGAASGSSDRGDQ